MRIARVLCADPEETAPFVRLALERDGALYDVGELDRIFDTAYSPDRVPCTDDYHARVVARGCAGLDALDERLRKGDRPTEARLFPDTFTWLPPCDTERAQLSLLAPGSHGAHGVQGARPSFRLGNARALLGHGERVVFPEDETRPDFEVSIAAVLGEDLEACSEAQARAAILGWSILNVWCGRDEAARDPSATRLVPSQLGPVLVTADEVGDLARLRAEVRVDGAVIGATSVAEVAGPIAASIAWLSRWTPLRAGDVIGVGRGDRGGACPAWSSQVDLLVERLGKLSGRPTRG